MQFLFVIIPKTYYKNVNSILQMNTIKLTKVFHAKGIYITQDNVRIVTIDLSSNFTFFVVHHTVFSSEHLKILFAYYMSVLLCPNSFKTNTSWEYRLHFVLYSSYLARFWTENTNGSKNDMLKKFLEEV